MEEFSGNCGHCSTGMKFGIETGFYTAKWHIKAKIILMASTHGRYKV